MATLPVSVQGLKAAIPHLCSIFNDAGYEDAPSLAAHIYELLSRTFDATDPAAEVREIGKQISHELEQSGLIHRFDEVFMKRNFRMANAVAKHLLPGQILDVQTGNGIVASMLTEMCPGCILSLTDEADMRHPMCKSLMWVAEPKGQYDQLLFLTVLHHCGNPEEVFRHYLDHLRSGGGVIIVENTFGDGDSDEREINVFFDWFFHNCVHPSDYPCPNTHKSIEEWTNFLKAENLKIEVSQDLGRFPMVKLLHHLWVACKK